MTKINTNCARHENRRSDEIWANRDMLTSSRNISPNQWDDVIAVARTYTVFTSIKIYAKRCT